MRVKTILPAFGIVLLLASLVFTPAQAQEQPQAILDAQELRTDPRFGFGGSSVNGIDYLGIPVYRRWGENGNADAQQALDRGAFSYFVVGKIDAGGYVALNRNADWERDGPRCRRSSNDSEVVSCTEVPHTGIPNHQDWEQIPQLAADYPGQIWEIGNEPDWHPRHSPEQYAVWFRLFEQRIRQADPTAQIMNGGLLMCCGENVYRIFQMSRTGETGWDVQVANANDRHAWTTRFRNHHNTLYGEYPQIDIWNIHTYVLTEYGFNATAKKDTTVQNILSFKNYLAGLPHAQNSPPEQSKPLYITEFGVLGLEGSIARTTPCRTRGCLTQAEYELEQRRVVEYMHRLVDWLMAESGVTRWFWFHWGGEPSQNVDNTGNMNTFVHARQSFFETLDEPNNMAISYAKRAGSPRLFNTSFETHYVEGTPYGWTFWASGPGSDYWHRVDTGTQRSGEKSLHLHVGAQAGEFGHISSVLQYMYTRHYNGRLARVEAWCKTSGPGRASLKLNPTNAEGVRDTYWEPGLTAPAACPDWKRIHTDWFIVPADTVRFEVELSATGANGDVWFDDVALVLAGDFDRSLAVNEADLAFLQEHYVSLEDGTVRDLGGDEIDGTFEYLTALLEYTAAVLAAQNR